MARVCPVCGRLMEFRVDAVYLDVVGYFVCVFCGEVIEMGDVKKRREFSELDSRPTIRKERWIK